MGQQYEGLIHLGNLTLIISLSLIPLLQVRKAAQHGVCSILRGREILFKDDAPSHHPAAMATAKFCIKEMEQAGGKKKKQ